MKDRSSENSSESTSRSHTPGGISFNGECDVQRAHVRHPRQCPCLHRHARHLRGKSVPVRGAGRGGGTAGRCRESCLPTRSPALGPCRGSADPPCESWPRGRALATSFALEPREGCAGLPAGRPAGGGQPLADLRCPVGHEIGNPPLSLQPGYGTTQDDGVHGAGEGGDGGVKRFLIQAECFYKTIDISVF